MADDAVYYDYTPENDYTHFVGPQEPESANNSDLDSDNNLDHNENPDHNDKPGYNKPDYSEPDYSALHDPDHIFNSDDDIALFFERTKTTRQQCDMYARVLAGRAGKTKLQPEDFVLASASKKTSPIFDGKICPVATQGNHSYTISFKSSDMCLLQFRLESEAIRGGVSALAYSTYKSLAPRDVMEIGWIPESEPDEQDKQSRNESSHGNKERLQVIAMPCMRGVTLKEFQRLHDINTKEEEYKTYRRNWVSGLIMLYERAWKNPLDPPNLNIYQPMDVYLKKLHTMYSDGLEMLRDRLPERFLPVVQACLDHLESITEQFALLPVVLQHKYLNPSEIMVDSETSEVTGIVGWHGCQSAVFGMNLYTFELIVTQTHTQQGVVRYSDYDDLQRYFWHGLTRRLRITAPILRKIKRTAVLGLLLDFGLTELPECASTESMRVLDLPEWYRLAILDGLLINEETKMDMGGML